MSQRKKVTQSMANSWIPESCTFFADVIEDTISKAMSDLDCKEQMALVKLKAQWMQNYQPHEHRPESNCNQPSAPVPRKRRRPAKKPEPKAKPEALPVDANTLADDVAVVYRINVPPLRPHWHCRSFDLRVAAHVCKNNLIEPLIDWQLLDSIMTLPLEEGTAKFQSYVNNKLKLQ